MGREIELKIPLTKSKYEEVLNNFYLSEKSYPEITIIDQNPVKIIKTDRYFSRYDTLEERREHNEPQVIRIRTDAEENGSSKSYFTIKTKKYENGIEINKEDETFLDNPEALCIFFEEAGYHHWFTKEKSAYSCHCSLFNSPDLVFHVELVEVNKHPYIEIEVTSESQTPDQISGELDNFVKKMGLNPEDKDPRSWYTICQSE